MEGRRSERVWARAGESVRTRRGSSTRPSGLSSVSSDEDAFCLPGAGKAPFTWDSGPHFQGARSGRLPCGNRFSSAFSSKQFACQSGTFGGMSCSPRPRVASKSRVFLSAPLFLMQTSACWPIVLVTPLRPPTARDEPPPDSSPQLLARAPNHLPPCEGGNQTLSSRAALSCPLPAAPGANPEPVPSPGPLHLLCPPCWRPPGERAFPRAGLRAVPARQV